MWFEHYALRSCQFDTREVRVRVHHAQHTFVQILISHHGHCFLDDFCFLFGHRRAEASVQCSAADSFTHLWFNKQSDFSFAVSIPFNPIQLLHIPFRSPSRAVVFLFHFTAFRICIVLVRWTVGDAFTGKHKHIARMNEAYSGRTTMH